MQNYINKVVKERKLRESKSKNYEYLMKKYPNKVLLYVYITNTDVNIPLEKFIISKDKTFGDFFMEIKKYITLGSKESLVYFIGGRDETVIPCMNDKINYLYQKHKLDNGVLYVSISKENTFGHPMSPLYTI